MKRLSALVLTILSGYTQLVFSADASYYGCYSDLGSLVKKNSSEFQSRGACRVTCTSFNPTYAVQGMTNKTICFCSQTLPNNDYKVDDSLCKEGCPGFEQETCGTRLGTYISVYLTGEEEGVPNQDPVKSISTSSASSSSSSVTTPTATPTSPGQIQTEPPASTPSKPVNIAGVAAGVVVGVLAIVGVGVGIFLLMKKKRREKVEEEYRKSAAAREFARKPEQDHRLDPVMIQRRDSVGSIADNQDYSRRILKVTNPDGN